jgi:hypothetical protein
LLLKSKNKYNGVQLGIVLKPSNTRFVILGKSSKAPSPTFVTLLGIVSFPVKLLKAAKASVSIVVTVFGMVKS